MGFYSRREQPTRRPSRLRLFFFLMLVYGCIKIFGGAHRSLFQPFHISHPPPPAPIVAAPAIAGDALADSGIRFDGRWVWGNGTNIDLGDRRTHPPGSLLSFFFPDPLNLTSCLTEPVPPAVPVQKSLPVRQDWPGFYGAPWIARADGNLIVLLNVYAPRNLGFSVPAPVFEIYPHYSGAPTPALSKLAAARFYRGSKAVLYRVFLTGPVRCLDLAVKNGENNGIGHLYYEKYHHFYEKDMTFTIQQ